MYRKILKHDNKLMKEQLEQARTDFNMHIDNTIGYIFNLKEELTNVIDLLDKLKFPDIYNRPPVIYSNS